MPHRSPAVGRPGRRAPTIAPRSRAIFQAPIAASRRAGSCGPIESHSNQGYLLRSFTKEALGETDLIESSQPAAQSPAMTMLRMLLAFAAIFAAGAPVARAHPRTPRIALPTKSRTAIQCTRLRNSQLRRPLLRPAKW